MFFFARFYTHAPLPFTAPFHRMQSLTQHPQPRAFRIEARHFGQSRYGCGALEECGRSAVERGGWGVVLQFLMQKSSLKGSVGCPPSSLVVYLIWLGKVCSVARVACDV